MIDSISLDLDGDDEVPLQRTLSISIQHAILTTIYHLLLDVVLYGCIVPVMGAYTGGSMAHMFGVPPAYELLLIVIISFSLMYGVLTVVGESCWVELFAFDSFYNYLLMVRDLVNIIFAVMCMISLATAVEGMIFEDKGMKERYLSEGVGYVLLKTIACDYLRVDRSFLLHIDFYETTEKSRLVEFEKYENTARWILHWATLTCCIAKFLYFNTLATYLRAVQIFINMRPAFIGI